MTCSHITFTPIIPIGKHHIVVGSIAELEDYIITGGNPWLVIDASASSFVFEPTKMSVLNGDVKLTALAKSQKFTHQTLCLDWQDRSIPTFNTKFWDRLWEYISTEHKGDVFIHCLGGHGRTGTIASILSKYAGICGDTNPILWLRKNYCEEAVESKSQIWYVETITGVNCDVVFNAEPPVKSQNYGVYGYPVTETYGRSPSTPVKVVSSTKSGRSHDSIVMEVQREMYDDLNWDGKTNGYLDSEGVFIGSTFTEAVTTLKERRTKAI